MQDEERVYQLEAQLKEAQLLAEEADRKYDEVHYFSLPDYYAWSDVHCTTDHCSTSAQFQNLHLLQQIQFEMHY